MRQQCHLAMIWLTWAIYLGGFAWLLLSRQWILAAAWLVAVPLFEWLYIRTFARLSSLLGYGAVADTPPPAGSALPVESAAGAHIPVHVTLYTALGCPFCPLMEQRLEALRAAMGFTLRKTDVTLRPNLLGSRGVRSVPAVEIDGRILPGLITSQDLAALIVQSIAQSVARPAE